jgi:uncharacterized protein with FMN-binding domain
MARKLNKNLVALGSAAIVGVYAIGYARTQTSANTAGAGTTAAAPPLIATAAPSPSPAPLNTQTAAATAIARAIAQNAATASPSPTAPPTAQAAANASGLRDGTFTGSGSNRRGDLSVAVTIQGGRITGAQITNYDMYYPASRISRLPGEVVDRQSANVDMVSGATYSASAFKQAVTQALAQAKA